MNTHIFISIAYCLLTLYQALKNASKVTQGLGSRLGWVMRVDAEGLDAPTNKWSKSNLGSFHGRTKMNNILSYRCGVLGRKMHVRLAPVNLK